MSSKRDVSNRKSGVAWPTADEFNTAVQNLSTSMFDEELRSGTAALDAMGLPLLYSGGFADVYRVECRATGNTWAVKCFTKGASGLRERYREISRLLDRKSLPFAVNFEYLDKGIMIRGGWYPIVKMHWVEGQTLNEFVAASLDEANVLAQLFKLWVRLSERMHREGIAHADLQHGNVMLVPKDDQGKLLLKLIDYDGMWIPRLADTPSNEVGHRNYQHPQRAAHNVYSIDVDRFCHLAICCALRCLHSGRHSLWNAFNNDDNLLFGEDDFLQPGQSDLFRELWTLRDREAHALVGHLVLGTQMNLDQVPYLHALVDEKSHVKELTRQQANRVNGILKPRSEAAVLPVSGAARGGTGDDEEFVVEIVEPSENKLTDGAEVVGAVDQRGDNLFDGLPPLEQTPGSTPQSAGANYRGRSSHGTGISHGIFARLDGRLAEIAGGANTLAHNIARVAFVGIPLCGVATLSAAAAIVFLGGESSPTDDDIAMVEPAAAPSESSNTTIDVERPDPAEPAPSTRSRQPQPDALIPTYTTAIGMELQLIPAGTTEEIQIPKDYYLGIYEVTQEQYRAVTGQSPSSTTGDDLPVVMVSADQADEFCRLLTEREQKANRLPQGVSFRLPTFAEWVHAAAGRESPAPFYKRAISSLAGRPTHPVGTEQPNVRGLYDMFGNVDEWVLDEAPDRVGDELVNLLSHERVDPLLHGYGHVNRLYVGEDSNPQGTLLASVMRRQSSSTRSGTIGFRVALAEPPTDILAVKLNEAIAIQDADVATDVFAFIEDCRPSDPRLQIWSTFIDELPSNALGPDDLIENSFGMKLRRIKAGKFIMGEDTGLEDQKPSHEVRLSGDFFIAMHEVTSAQYHLISGLPDRASSLDRRPISLTFEKAEKFCKDLTAKESLPGGLVYRLPTEAEWEYAARAGSTTTWFFGDVKSVQSAPHFMWSQLEKAGIPRPVGLKIPNQWGLFDIAGNVSEWVLDSYDADTYRNRAGAAVVDPMVPGTEHVVRGGSVAEPPNQCTSAIRVNGADGAFAGIRVVLALPVSELRSGSRREMPEPREDIELLLASIESAIAKKDVDSAEELLAKIESIYPGESQLEALRKRVSGLDSPASPMPAPPAGPVTTITNSIGMKLVKIAAGEFEMGSESGADIERPVHRVKISRPYYLGMYEVTQEQYETVMGDKPSRFAGEELPVENVSADDADAFCRRLIERERALKKLPDGVIYRLPTEAEWEYAARAGTTTQWYCGDTDTFLDRFAWFAGNSDDMTHPCGEKLANAWGLHDMLGNVFEWTADQYMPQIYEHHSKGDVVDPMVNVSWDGQRVHRGGSWHRTQRYCRSATRSARESTLRREDVGFRVALIDNRGQ